MSEKITLRKKPTSGFLAQYLIGRQYLQQPDPKSGIPGLRVVTDPQGRELLLKDWPRGAANDDAGFRDLWQNEIRQLHQLASHPSSRDSIVTLFSSAIEADAFYVLLDADQRVPLSTLQTRGDAPGWIKSPVDVRGRALLWGNLRRIAVGLDTLHAQGLLHRNLSARSVLTRGDDEPDFLLTGFEWSMRLISGNQSSAGHLKPWAMNGAWESFTMDWRDLGRLAASLFKISEKTLLNLSLPHSAVSSDLLADEVKLLRVLLGITRSNQPIFEAAIEQIDSIRKALTLRAEKRESRLTLAVSFGENSSLSRAIRDASGQTIEINDTKTQIEFIQNDLRVNATAIASGRADRPRLSLRGYHLCYSVRDFRVEGVDSGWALAFCSEASAVSNITQRVLGEVPFAGDTLDLASPGDALRGYARLRARGGAWLALKASVTPPSITQTGLESQFKAFVLNQVLEGLYAISEAFPVEVLVTGAAGKGSEGMYRLELRPLLEPDVEEISKLLGHRDPPATRLRKALTGEDEPSATSWILTDVPVIDEAEESSEWQFLSTSRTASVEQFSFTGDDPTHSSQRAYLVRSDSTARDLQLRRRMSALRTFKIHDELARMLFDPRSTIKATHESIVEDAALQALDIHKQDALKRLVSILPLFLVQGPPGVGKTRLVTELVRRRYAEDKTLRMLFTAQSHHAVDHLLDKIKEVFPPADPERPLLVRCRPKDSDRSPTEDDLPERTRTLVRDVVKSPLFQSTTPALRERGRSLSTALVSGGTHSQYERRALEGLVLRSANLVFASSNAADLERLIEERGTFDWSIIEEAAKATGAELISALLLSHRRLLIGDHQQLPPFDSERFRQLLRSSADVQKALQLAESQMGKLFRDPNITDLISELVSEDGEEEMQAIGDLAALADTRLFLFESLIMDELARQKSNSANPIAKKLTFQHRMHPAIARVISRAFYDEELETHPDREAYFAREPGPVMSADASRLPDAPIVWIEMPWVQSTMNLKEGEQRPVYHNTQERVAVLEVLRLLKPRNAKDGKPSLAVLSPYAQQVKRLAADLPGAPRALTAHLDQFHAASHEGKFVGTVDSFQGNEADVVVVSLVRNNRGGVVGSALGFLADARRMNVMLSRARWRLIMVGSLRFLQDTVRADQAQSRGEPIKFLPELLAALETAQQQGDMKVVSVSRILA